MKKEEINKVHLLFEQSGTFKNEFLKMGIPAEDYDIQNNFGETDNVIDLFSEIDTDFEQNRTEQNRTEQNRTGVPQSSILCQVAI